MKVISIGNEKGGVLKTTITTHLAKYLVDVCGKSVVLLDLDTQGGAAGFFIGNSEQGVNPRTDYKVIAKTTDLFSNDFEVPKEPLEGLNLIVGDKRLADCDAFGMHDILKSLRKIKQIDVDYILIDYPPTTSYRVLGAMAVSDGIFIPTDFSRPSNNGLEDIMVKIKGMMKKKDLFKSKIKVLGVVGTLIDRRSVTQTENFKSFYVKYGPDIILPEYLPLRPKVKDALDKNTFVWEVKKGDPKPAINDFNRVLNEMYKRIQILDN